jgi:hypothetical protein
MLLSSEHNITFSGCAEIISAIYENRQHHFSVRPYDCKFYLWNTVVTWILQREHHEHQQRARDELGENWLVSVKKGCGYVQKMEAVAFSACIVVCPVTGYRRPWSHGALCGHDEWMSTTRPDFQKKPSLGGLQTTTARKTVNSLATS